MTDQELVRQAWHRPKARACSAQLASQRSAMVQVRQAGSACMQRLQPSVSTGRATLMTDSTCARQGTRSYALRGLIPLTTAHPWLSMMPVLGDSRAATQWSSGSMAMASSPSSHLRSVIPFSRPVSRNCRSLGTCRPDSLPCRLWNIHHRGCCRSEAVQGPHLLLCVGHH